MGYNQGGVIHTNGTFTTWGYENTYPDYRLKVNDAKSITIGRNAGAILRESNSNSVVAWGDSILGGKIRILGENGSIITGNEIKLDEIKKINMGNDTGIALKNDGTIFTWGLYTSTYYYDDSIKNLSDVKDVKINYNTGIVIKNDNTAVTWSRLNKDSRPENSNISLRNVKSIVSNENAGIVLYLDGAAVTYGKSEYGGKYNYKKPVPTTTSVLNIVGIKSGSLKNIKQVCMTKGAGAALTNDGNVFIWGNDTLGGLNNTNADLTNVKKIFSGGNAFAALKNDNTVVTWGKINSGGDFKYSGSGPKIQVRNSEQETTVIGLNESDLTDIVDISMGEYAGMALKKNGDVLTWGVKDFGAIEDVIKNVRLPYIENKSDGNNNNDKKSNIGMIILIIFLVILGIFILLFALQYFGVINIKFIQKIIKRPV